MGAAIPIITSLVGVASAASSIIGIKKSAEKPPEPPKPPSAPTTESAKTSAADELQKRRRISLLSGGDTDITRGAALVDSSQVGKKSLLGA